VNPTAVEVMREKGIDLSGHRSKTPADLPAGPFDCLITMGCGDACPSVPAKKRIEWDIPDPKGKGLDIFRQVRDQIEEKVRGFVGF